jgi:hypothetical protein
MVRLSRAGTDALRQRALKRAAQKRSSVVQGDRYLEIADDIYQRLYPIQRALLDDPNNQKAALCTRRAGKTHACRADLLYTALTQPESYSVYVNKSRQECRRIMWNGKDGLKALCRGYGIEPKINETYLEMTFANGSIIQLVGADDSAEIEKLRGSAYDKVIVDEAASFGQLEYFSEDIILPALGDRQGTLILIGTPSYACAGYFYEITRDDNQKPGWSTYRWTFRENTALPFLAEYYERRKIHNKWDDNHPTWLREYCAKWVQSAEYLVYDFNLVPEPERYWCESQGSNELPGWSDNTGKYRSYEWEYYIGIDIGYKDPFAYTIWASCPNLAEKFEIRSFKQSQLNADQQFELLESLAKEYSFTKMVVDSTATGKGTVEAWKARGLALEDAIKVDKHPAIHMANAFLAAKRLKFYRGSPLAAEMEILRYDPKTLGSARPKEDKAFSQNDVCDSFIYLFKEWMADEPEDLNQAPAPGTKEAIEMEMLEYERKMDEQFEAQQVGRYSSYYQQADPTRS